MDITTLTAFAGVAALVLVIPGPDWVFLISAGTAGSRVGAAVGGLMIGYAIITAAVAVGLGALIAAVPFALTVVAVLGAGYLVYLGAAILRSGPDRAHPSAADAAGPRLQGANPLIQGIGVSALNPKALLFFLAILPLFVRSASPLPATAQLGVFGAIYIVIGTAFYLLLGTVAGRLSRTARAGMLVNRISGGLMLVIGALMLIEQALAISHALAVSHAL